MSGYVIRSYVRIMGWKPMPRKSQAFLVETRSKRVFQSIFE
jgi:hypothetical protein